MSHRFTCSQLAKSALVFAFFTTLPFGVLAQGAAAYPSKPVRLVVGFAPGGPTDVAARVIAEKVSALWGQQMIVDNRPGAGGNLGAEIVARAAPDGYTLVLGVTGSHAINLALQKSLPYHPLKDFEAVSQATQFPNAIAVHPSVPARTLQELMALARRDPGKLSYGTDGVGTASHLTMELLKSKAGVNLVSVPYKGAAPMVAELIGGQIQVGITGLPAMQAHARAGKIRIIAVTTPQRVASSADIATISEQGFPGFSAAPLAGFFAPKGTPPAILGKLSADLVRIMRLPEVQEKLVGLGSAVVASSPEEFRRFVETEIQNWAEAVKVSGVKVE